METDFFPDSTTRHGTLSGWRKHIKIGERPCDPCYFAKQEYDQRRLKAPGPLRRNRLRARAQARATTRLRNMFPEEWKVLYAQAWKEVFEEDEKED